MKLDPGMHIGMHLVFFGKSGVTCCQIEPPGDLAFFPGLDWISGGLFDEYLNSAEVQMRAFADPVMV
jgi:hypothetical protein